MKKRTSIFAWNCIELCNKIQNNPTSAILARQLIRSATSVAANYRASQRAKSRKDFLYKINVIEEEADECILWIEFLEGLHPEYQDQWNSLKKEANELTAIFTAIGRNAKLKAKNN